MTTLLETALSGDLPRLRERLENASRRIHQTSTGGAPLTESEQLIDEALVYARLGDLDEATHRLRLRAQPKFSSLILCEIKYAEAMAAKRAGAAS